MSNLEYAFLEAILERLMILLFSETFAESTEFIKKYTIRVRKLELGSRRILSRPAEYQPARIIEQRPHPIPSRGILPLGKTWNALPQSLNSIFARDLIRRLKEEKKRSCEQFLFLNLCRFRHFCLKKSRGADRLPALFYASSRNFQNVLYCYTRAHANRLQTLLSGDI